MFEIAIVTAFVSKHIAVTEETEFPHNSFLTKDYMLKQLNDLKNKLDAARHKALQKAGI